MANGVGSLRFIDPLLGQQAGFSNMAEPWQMTALNGFTWFYPTTPTYTVHMNEARALQYSGMTWTTTNSPYFYGDQTLFPDGSSWLAASGLSAAITDTTSTVITIASAATDPIFYSLVLQIEEEQMRVVSVSGTSVTVLRGSNGTTAATHASQSPQ